MKDRVAWSYVVNERIRPIVASSFVRLWTFEVCAQVVSICNFDPIAFSRIGLPPVRHRLVPPSLVGLTKTSIMVRLKGTQVVLPRAAKSFDGLLRASLFTCGISPFF